MPLVNCEDCNRPISSRAKVCPHCGAPRDSLVAKVAGVLIAVAAVGGLGWIIYLDQMRARELPSQAARQVVEPEKEKKKVAAAPKPAPRKGDSAQRAAQGAKALKKTIANSDASRLQSALVIDGSGAICYEYEASNAFGGFSSGKAVLPPESNQVVSSDMSGFSRLWSQECDKKSGTQIASAINWHSL